MAAGQSKRIIVVDFVEGKALQPVFNQVMARLPQVRLETLPPAEKGREVHVVITAFGRDEDLEFFLDEAEEIFQDELDTLGLQISVHLTNDDWGTE